MSDWSCCMSTERPSNKSVICPPLDEMIENFMVGMKKVMHIASNFSSVALLEHSATQSSLTHKPPVPFTSLQEPKYTNIAKEQLKATYQDVVASTLRIS